jgi:hypothetical protein
MASTTMASTTMPSTTMASTTVASTTMNNGKAKNAHIPGSQIKRWCWELEGVEGSTTVPVLDGVEGSTTVPVLDGVEGITYRTVKSTTKSTMVLPNLSMCELDLRHLQIHLPQLGFQSSYRHQKRIHRNRGRRRRRRDADESRHRAPRHCRYRDPRLCRCARSSRGFRSTKGTSSI